LHLTKELEYHQKLSLFLQNFENSLIVASSYGGQQDLSEKGFLSLSRKISPKFLI
jgi:hypothetical protein